MADEAEVSCERQGAAGVITLNRPQSLNALTLGMVRAMRRALDAWADDAAITRVIIEAAGGRAFCAGGDIRRLYDLGKARRYDEALAFWREEYALNIRIKRYPKPYIALVDGIVMGGGVGVSLHGSHRVAGERYQFAMPEVGIGFFPDVGATYALPRLPGRTGTYLALTGDRVRTADALELGLATHVVGSASFGELREALIAGEPAPGVLARLSIGPGDCSVSGERALIDRCLSVESVTEVLSRLDRAAAEGSLFAGNAAAAIRTKSPTSLAIALEQMRRGRDLDFEEALRTEFRIVSRLIRGRDFYEGVRATIIDKDGAPRWRPAALEEVEPAEIERHFSDLDEAELKVA
jgi:enoyl-CoA hydratase